jgi:formylglycine-generating enzyme
MTGNALEWVADWYGEDYYSKSPDHNPKGPPNGQKRVARGGSWPSPPHQLRSTMRRSYDPAFDYGEYLGFRCAQDAK